MQSMITMKSLLSFPGTKKMASITIRNLDDDVKERLRLVAARHGISMEEEVRRILKNALQSVENEYGLGTRIQEIWAKAGGFELPDRKMFLHRPLPDFSDSEE
jgi:plasmid stability protein